MGFVKHNLSKHPLHDCWRHILQRCCNKNNSRFNQYGGRGIDVCNLWKKDFKSFYEWAIRSGYKKGLTIERINNDKGYFPENCKFANYIEQNGNRRIVKINEIAVKVIKYLLKQGVKRKKIARAYKVSYDTIRNIDRGTTWKWVY